MNLWPKLKKQLARPRWQISLALLVSAVLFAIAAYNTRHHLSTDAIGYISIAKQYAGGHFHTALNDLFPPLYSWLMVPLLKLGLNGQVSALAINWAAALLAQGVGMWLAMRYARSRKTLAAGLFWLMSLPFFIFAVGNLLTPDLMVVAWVAVFLAALSQVEQRRLKASWRFDILTGLGLGALGTLGYFTKQYLLPFFVGSTLVWLVTRSTARRSKKAFWSRQLLLNLRLPLLALIFMMLLASPWVAALSHKKGKFTVAGGFSYNFGREFVQPGDQPKTKTPATPTSILSPPPSQYATSNTECPNCGQPPPASGHHLRLGYFLEQRFKQLPAYVRTISSLWVFIVPVGLAVLAAWLLRKFSYKDNSTIILAWLLLAVYFAGYAMLVEDRNPGGIARYYWPLFWLATWLAAVLAPNVLAWLRQQKQPLVAGVVGLVLLALPISAIAQNGPDAARYLKHQAKPSAYKLYKSIGDLIPPGSQIASNNWRQTQMLAYYLGAQSFGSINSHNINHKFTDPEVQAEFKKFGIDYFIDFTPKLGSKFDAGQTKAKVLFSFQQKLGCSDLRNAKIEPCQISVVKLN